mgnify:CR=1 FL=1
MFSPALSLANLDCNVCIDLSTCAKTFEAENGTLVDLSTIGAPQALIGKDTNPPVGNYPYAYVKLSNTFVLKGSQLVNNIPFYSSSDGTATKNIGNYVEWENKVIDFEKGVQCEPLPKNRLIWSSWNYSTNSKKQISCITYWMNKLQNLNTKKNIFITLNPINIPSENKIIKIFKYEHPIYDQNSLNVQKQIKEYQGKNNIYFAGAWNGYGFHEDGVKSALNVIKKLNIDIRWLLNK